MHDEKSLLAGALLLCPAAFAATTLGNTAARPARQMGQP